MLTDNITTYLTVSGRIWRFVDTSPGDTTSTNSFSNCWHLVSAPGSTTCSGGTIIPDNAPTDISSSKATLFDNTGIGATIATLTPTDTGDTLRGFWTLESQSVPNLFALSFNRTTGNTATLTRGSGAVPAIGQTPTVTVRYHDVYQTDASGNPIAGQGFSKTLTFTVVSEVSNALTLGNDVAVNTFTTGNQSGQSVALLSTGNVAVVWQSAAQGGGDTGGNSGIYGQLLSSAGAKVGGEFVISNASSNIDEVTPVVSALASGRYVVAYATNAGGDYNIRFRLVEANGSVGGEFIANSTTAGAQTYPAIVTTTDGNFVVAWNSDNGDIRARKFNTAGAAVTGEVLFADGNVAGGYYPFVAALSNGDYALAWADYAASHVFFKVAGVAGVTDTGIITGGYTPPRVVGLSGGGFVLASESYNAGSTRYQIEAIRYSNAGVVQTAKFQVNSVSTGNRYAASVAALTGGGFIVGWGADNGDFDLSGIFGRRYSATAVAVDAAEFEINQHRLDDQNYPALAPLAGDLFLATWTEVTGASIAANTYFGDIEARVLGPASTPDLTVTKVANGVFQRGGTASFTVTVTNSGTGPTSAAYTLTDSMPTGLTLSSVTTPAGWDCTASTSTFVSCTRSTALAAAASSTITISVNIAANTPASITNTANVAGGGEVVTSNDSGSATVDLTPLVSIAVAPASVAENGSTDLVYTLTNSPAVSTATTVNITTSGTATAGTDYSGGVATVVIPANAPSATITINPTGDTTLEPDETVILTVASGSGYAVGSPSSATGTIQNDDVALPPTVSKFFVNPAQGNSNNTTLNGTARLSIAITNPPANSTNLTGLAISDNFPPGIEVDASPAPTNTCGGSFAPTAGATSISFSGGGPLTPANQCTISVVVRATAAGALVNTTGTVSATESGVGLTASATLNVYQPPVVTKSFTPANILQNQNSVLRFTIQSPTAGLNLSGVNLTDNFPSGMVMGSPPVISSTNCGGLTLTDSGGGSLQTGDTGVRLNNFLAPAVTPCVVQLNVVGQTVGALINTTDAPTSTNGGTGLAATATLNVGSSADLAITKSDGVTSATPGGSVTYTISASNAGPSVVTGATVADTFPAILTCNWTCVGAGGGTCTASGGGNINDAVNLPVGASATYTASCTIAASATGTLSNTATVTSSVNDPNSANDSATDNDTLIPQADLRITKTNSVSSVTSGSSTTYTIAATNFGPSNVPSATVADTFPAACQTPTWTCAGTGGGTCTVSGGGNINDTVVLPLGGSVSYTAVCPISAFATGTLSNTASVSSAITDPVGGNNSATDNDSIVRPLTSVVSLNRASGNPRNSPTATWTITFAHPVDGLSAGNFAPVNGGLGGAIVVSPPTESSGPPSAVWNVTVSTGTGSGTLGLDLIGDAGMTHSVGNLPFTGEVFTIDRIAPSATITVTDANLVAGETSPVSIVFNEAVTGFDATDLAVENGSVLPLQTSDNITYTTTLTPTAAIVDPSNLITLAAGSALDAASNPNTASASNNYAIDTRVRQISVNDVSIVEGNSGSSNLNFTVSLSLPAANGGVGFDIATQDGTANAPGDYTASSQIGASIAEGASSLTFAVPVNGDALVEANETLLVNLANVVGATVIDGQGQGTITNDDSAGVTITQTGTTDVTEGGATDTYTAVLTSQPTADVTITPSTTGEVSISPASRIFTAANWNVAQSFTVTANDDAIVEGAESATITHSSASGDANYQGATVASVTAAISDNDSATVQFAPSTLSQTEANSPMAFTVTLSAPVQSGVTLTLNSAPGTATAADFTAIIGGTVTFAPNTSTSQTVNVVINNDALDENDESYTLTLSGLTATGAVTLGAATATGTILDDDPTPTISVTSPSLAEGNAGTSLMNFVVSLNAVSGRDVSFTRATVDGTATVANNDYVALSAATATIPAGQTSLSIPVTINGDTPYEGDESFSLAITGVSNATPASISGTGTIIDDDQQPTTTTITGDTPDPTVVGQAYTVSASVVAQTTSPLGTVTISDGSASCNATLTTGAAPNSTMSCLLTSTSAGAKTLTANYTPASSAFAASSDTDTHQVNAAATTISVSGPARSRINQATSFSFALAVTTPGAGTPTGVVTLSSGPATCTATLPATSCNLTFTTLGARTVTASYASDGNFLSSSSSGAGNAQTLVYALSDLSISKTDGIGYYEPGDLLVYSVIVRNLGPDDAANIRVVDTIPAGLTDVVWSCDASGGGVCPAAGGAGNFDVVLANVRVGALLNFTFFGNVAGSPLVIANTASIVLPADTTIDDPSLSNNSATDTDQIDFTFRDGFEDPPVSAPSGSARIPALALVRELGDEARVVLSLKDAQGEALRVYARLHDESLQYALARRSGNGQLRLEAWRSLPGEPTLSWSARAVATGWVIEGAELR